MGSEYLSKLNLTEEERSKLAALGTSTPAMLLSVRRASPEAFEALVGKERAEEITLALEELLTPEEKQRLARGAAAGWFSLGARLDRPPEKLPPPPYDIEERDRIFKELQSLKKSQPPTPSQKKRIADLETRLNNLLAHH